jgi:hypothetical protein
MVDAREAQPLAAQQAPQQHDDAGEAEAQRNTDLRRRHPDLVGDGMPGRAPDEDAGGKELPASELHHSFDRFTMIGAFDRLSRT